MRSRCFKRCRKVEGRRHDRVCAFVSSVCEEEEEEEEEEDGRRTGMQRGVCKAVCWTAVGMLS
eukprot:3922777-Rhodomonas_salina.2